jgi:hypothetical protein
MNSLNHPDHDPFDIFIGRSLKNWLDRQNPPADAKERLLYTASISSLEKTHFLQFWLPFLRYIALRITSGLSPNQEELQYPLLSHNSSSIHENIHAWGAYQTMIRTLPTGRGLLCFLY